MFIFSFILLAIALLYLMINFTFDFNHLILFGETRVKKKRKRKRKPHFSRLNVKNWLNFVFFDCPFNCFSHFFFFNILLILKYKYFEFAKKKKKQQIEIETESAKMKYIPIPHNRCTFKLKKTCASVHHLIILYLELINVYTVRFRMRIITSFKFAKFSVCFSRVYCLTQPFRLNSRKRLNGNWYS